jgi:ornithine cyclodeaminase/alanine dehydrogenase
MPSNTERSDEPMIFRFIGRIPWDMKPLRHLSANEVAAAMPPLGERLALAELTMRSLGVDAELPAKIGVHPRQPGSLAHAMPALLKGKHADGSQDLLGAKWITGFPANPVLGLPAYHGLVLLNDPANGEPIAVMDAGTITAQRTAAISGVAIRHLMNERAAARSVPEAPPAAAPVVALLGAGVQAASHLPVIGAILPGATIRLTDVDGRRAAALAAAAPATPGIATAAAFGSVRDAVEGADVVISMVSFGSARQALDPEWLGPDVLFVAVDYDMQAPAALARDARFIVDDRAQFLATRSGTVFKGYPEPDATIGELLRGDATAAGAPAAADAGAATATAGGRVLVSHLGVGLADVVFGAAILARAELLGLGRLLPR